MTAITTVPTPTYPFKVLASAQGIGDSTYSSWVGATRLIQVSGAFNGATVTIKARLKSLPTQVVVLQGSYTAAAITMVNLTGDYEVSLSVSGGTAPSVNLYLV